MRRRAPKHRAHPASGRRSRRTVRHPGARHTVASAALALTLITAPLLAATAPAHAAAAFMPASGIPAIMDAKAAASGLGARIGRLGSARGGGAYQNYQRGAVLWTPTSGAHISRGAIRSEWAALGFENGTLGYPTTDEVPGLQGGGTYQSYEGGAIVWSPLTDAHESVGAIRNEWAALGFENGTLGYPTTDEVPGLQGGGTYQSYQGGAIVWSPATGAHISHAAIRKAWAAAGFENGPLGYPTTDEVSGLRGGGAYQTYQGGAIVWSPATDAHTSHGAIRSTWADLGFENGALGYPTTEEIGGLRGGGAYQAYQGGVIVWAPGAGAHDSVGAIRAAWASTGFESGPLGYPTSNEYPIAGGVAQNYQGGRIEWRPGGGDATVVLPAPPNPKPTPQAPSGSETPAQVQAMVRQTATRMGLDPTLALAIAEQESGFGESAVSSVGAIGVMQIMPANRGWLAGLTGRPNLDLHNTSDNIAAGVAMLRSLVAGAANLDQAIAGYYQGLGSVQARGMYDDTKAYVAQVKARMAKY